jgi:prepilin-type N-terminal cleavage/methylation domain-containing protein
MVGLLFVTWPIVMMMPSTVRQIGPGLRFHPGFSLLETMMVLALLAMVVSLALPPLRIAIGAGRLEADLQNLGSALVFARSSALYSGLAVQVEGLHMRRNLTKNGVRQPRPGQANPWFQGVLLYANHHGSSHAGYDRREDLRDYRFLSSVQVSSAQAAYRISPSGVPVGEAPMLFVLREQLSQRCATLRLTAEMSWPEVCRGKHCSGCLS